MYVCSTRYIHFSGQMKNIDCHRTGGTAMNTDLLSDGGLVSFRESSLLWFRTNAILFSYLITKTAAYFKK